MQNRMCYFHYKSLFRTVVKLTGIKFIDVLNLYSLGTNYGWIPIITTSAGIVYRY